MSASGKPFWTRAKGESFKYSDKAGEHGPVGTVLIKRASNGTWRVKAVVDARGGAVDLVPPSDGTDGVATLEVDGGDRYCMLFGADGQVRNVGDVLFKVSRPLAEGCGALATTTSTSTSSSTSTSTSTSTSSSTTTLVAGCYLDTGLTVVDFCNHREWEKKETAVGSGANAGNLHDVDNAYSWAGECTISHAFCQPSAAAAAACLAYNHPGQGCVECGVADGTCDVDPDALGAISTIWEWAAQLNTASFAGHTDWRIPTFAGIPGSPTLHPPEFELIVDDTAGVCGGGSGACINPVFGATVADAYWSGSPLSPIPPSFFAWRVGFNTLNHNSFTKTLAHHVRAVRTVP